MYNYGVKLGKQKVEIFSSNLSSLHISIKDGEDGQKRPCESIEKLTDETELFIKTNLSINNSYLANKIQL